MTSMTSVDYAALHAAPIAADPYPHLLVPHFVPAGALAGVIADLPRLAGGGSFPLDALSLGPHAASLAAELQGERFRAAIADRFDLDLRGAPIMATLRGRSRAQDGRIHTDSAAKRVTVLLYLNQGQPADHAGCLRLLPGPDDIERHAIEIPPTDGTLLVFPNRPDAWHGHKPFIGPRSVIQLNYMTNGRAARWELRRHRLSAAVKRLAG